MYHTNASYRRDSDVVSLGSNSPNRPVALSPGRVRRINDHSVSSREHSPHLTTDRSMDIIDASEQKNPDGIKTVENESDEDAYYSLKRLRERRRGERDEDSGLSRRVRRFYKDQDELIDLYERVNIAGQGNDDQHSNEQKAAHAKVQRLSNILTKVSLAVNIVSFILLFSFLSIM